MSAAQTGRTHDLHPTASRKPKEPLDPWAPSTHDPRPTKQFRYPIARPGRLSIGRLRADPGPRRQGRQFGRQSVEHALHEAIAQRAGLFSRSHEPIRYQQSQSMHKGPSVQNRAGNLAFVTGGSRNSASQTARDDYAREQRLGLLGFGQFDRGAGTIQDRLDNLRTSDCKAPDSQRHGQCNRATSRITARGSCSSPAVL